MVGHSMGGITASIAAARFGVPVIYVAALLPRAGSRLADLFSEMMCEGIDSAQERREDGLSYWWPEEAERYGLDASVLRGQSTTPYFDVLDDPTPGRYVACARDQVVSPDFQRTVADVVIDCGHLPHIECPEELADNLIV